MFRYMYSTPSAGRTQFRFPQTKCHCKAVIYRSLRLQHRYSEWLRAGPSGDRNPVGAEIFRTYPDWPWGPPSLRYSAYRVLPEGKVA